jgi:hypothetical protein
MWRIYWMAWPGYAIPQMQGEEHMKTVLAPNAPWPSNVEVKKPAPKKRVPPPPKSASKIQKTDKMFQQWASKNLGASK